MIGEAVRRQHMDRVASLGCIVCRREFGIHTPARCHHPRFGQGTGQRADDFLVIPLCDDHHQTGGHGVAIHAGQRSWEALYGTEMELLAHTIALLEARTTAWQ